MPATTWQDRKHAAGRAALLNGLQNLPDGFAVVIGGAAGRARLLDRFEARPIGAGPGVEGALVEIERALIVVLRGRASRRLIAVGRTARIVGCRRVRDVQGFLNGRKRDFCRVFDLFGIVRHVQSEPSFYFLRIGILRLSLALTALASSKPAHPRAVESAAPGSACPLHPQTSYWLGRANEMAPINTILIIVNSRTP